MTQAQESRQDKIYDLVMAIHSDVQVLKNSHATLSQDNIDNAKGLVDTNAIVTSILADRNRAVGAMWLGGSVGLLSGIGTIIMALINKYT